MIRYTSKVRRGLTLMYSLVSDAMDDSKPPAAQIVKGWTLAKQREFNQACEWIEQETAEREAEGVTEQEAQPTAPQ